MKEVIDRQKNPSAVLGCRVVCSTREGQKPFEEYGRLGWQHGIREDAG